MKKNSDFFAGWVIVIFSILYFINSFSIAIMETGSVTSVTYPRVLAVFFCFLGALLIIQSQKGIVEKIDEDGLEKVEVEVSTVGKKRVGITIALLLLYGLVVKKLGFFLTTILYMILQILTFTDKIELNTKNIVKSVVFSVFFTLIIYLIFTKALSMVLPRGILSF